MTFSGFGTTGMWLIIMIVMIVIEAAAPGLVSIWFALGALAALIASAMQAPIYLQVTLFVVVSIAALLLTRPLAQKYVNGRTQATNADMIIGRECLVREQVDNLSETGAVSVGGKTWTARSTEESVIIPVGSKAIVEKIEGVKAIVRRID